MADPEKSIENLRSNLRASIQNLVAATRNEKFSANNPDTQTLLKNFASKAHTYQKRAIAARNKLNGNLARANVATVASVAGAVAKAANTKNASPARLQAVMRLAAALLAKLKPVKTATTKQNIIGRSKFPIFLKPNEKRELVKAYLAKNRNQVKNREFLKKRGLFARGWQNENLARFWAAVNAQKALNAQGAREAAKVRKTEEDARKTLIKQIIRWNARRAPGAPMTISTRPRPLPGTNKMKIINKQKFQNNLTTAFKGRKQNINALMTDYFPWPQVPEGGPRGAALSSVAST